MADMTKQEAAEWLERFNDGMSILDFFKDYRGSESLRMAIAALQASVPRVLAKSELQTVNQETPVWVEFCPEGNMRGLEHVAELRNILGYTRDFGYGRFVRVWAGAKPSADQMDATPWDKQEG